MLRSASRASRLVRPAALPALAARCRPLCTAAGPPDIDVDAVAYGFMTSQALFTALELGVFDAIAGSPTASLNLEEIKASESAQTPLHLRCALP